MLRIWSKIPFTSKYSLHRSEEPDEKKMLTDDPTLASAQMMDGDMQVNQAAYNYNAWYQVGVALVTSRARAVWLYAHWGFPGGFICLWPRISWWGKLGSKNLASVFVDSSLVCYASVKYSSWGRWAVWWLALQAKGCVTALKGIAGWGQ